MSDAWRIVEDDLSGAPIRALLEVHFAGMLANSPKDSCHPRLEEAAELFDYNTDYYA